MLVTQEKELTPIQRILRKATIDKLLILACQYYRELSESELKTRICDMAGYYGDEAKIICGSLISSLMAHVRNGYLQERGVVYKLTKNGVDKKREIFDDLVKYSPDLVARLEQQNENL